MSSKKVKILMNRSLPVEKNELIKNYYSSWRTANKTSNASFTLLYSSFKERHLSTLEAGPLRLYLYFSFSADNTTGHSWHSIQKIANFFNTQTRTIDNWIKVLVDADLIHRERVDKVTNTTFIIPYGDTWMNLAPSNSKIFKEDNQKLVNNLVEVVSKRKEVYGEIIRVYHLFQWKVTKKETLPKHFLLIITQRKNGVCISHTYEFGRMSEYSISELEIENIATFSSKFQYNNKPIQGIAIDNDSPIQLNNKSKDVSDIFDELKEADENDLKDHPEVDFGLFEEFFTLESEEDESEEGEESKVKEGKTI